MNLLLFLFLIYHAYLRMGIFQLRGYDRGDYGARDREHVHAFITYHPNDHGHDYDRVCGHGCDLYEIPLTFLQFMCLSPFP